MYIHIYTVCLTEVHGYVFVIGVLCVPLSQRRLLHSFSAALSDSVMSIAQGSSVIEGLKYPEQ